jgi:hypothetical protein
MGFNPINNLIPSLSNLPKTVGQTGCVKTKFLLTNSGIPARPAGGYAGDGNDNTKWTLVQRIDIKG